MIWTIAIIFALVWVLGLVTAYTAGGYVHVLLAVAVVLLLVGTFKAGTKSARRGSTGRTPPKAAGGAVVGADTARSGGGPV